MKFKKLKPAKDMEWIQPVKTNYLMGCCDCGLVHRMDFRIVENTVQFRATRAKKYTAIERKKNNIKIKELK